MMRFQSRIKPLFARYFWWAVFSRFKSVQNMALMLMAPKGDIPVPSSSAVRMIVSGDVCLDHEVRTQFYLGCYRLKDDAVRRHILTKIKRKLLRVVSRIFLSPRFFCRYINDLPFVELLVQKPENEKRRYFDNYWRKAIRFPVDYSSARSQFDYPFEKMSPFMKSRDIVFANLETPLTGHTRASGFFKSDPHYAEAMKNAGISIVSLANNHVFDAGEIGFLETVRNLERAGISYVGAGENFEKARAGKFLQVRGLGIIFLAYTQFCNARYASIAAEHPGILPLDRQLIIEDIQAARKKAEFVFVSLHWGEENQPGVHQKQVEIAHLLIDAGADGIIGHHPHVVHGIEIYKKRPVLYSLGNFIFGHSMPVWNDNYVAEIIIENEGIRGIMLYPVSGRVQELFQPEILGDSRGDSLLRELQIKSATFGTGIAIQDHIGHIKIQ